MQYTNRNAMKVTGTGFGGILLFQAGPTKNGKVVYAGYQAEENQRFLASFSEITRKGTIRTIETRRFDILEELSEAADLYLS